MPRVLFLFLGGISILGAIGVSLWDDDPVHEIGAYVLLLASVILFSTGIIVGLLEALLKKK